MMPYAVLIGVMAAPMALAAGGITLVHAGLSRWRSPWSDVARGLGSAVAYPLAVYAGNKAGMAWYGKCFIDLPGADFETFFLYVSISFVFIATVLVTLPLGVILPARLGSLHLRSDLIRRRSLLGDAALGIAVGAPIVALLWWPWGGWTGFVRHLHSLGFWPTLLLGIFLIAPCEEMIYRWQILGGLVKALGRPWIACLIQAVLFACSHTYVVGLIFRTQSPQVVAGLIGLGWLAAIGFVFGVMRLWRGVLLPCYLAHAVAIALSPQMAWYRQYWG
jgi:membrane protease YdiL (CAAX protease family)